MPGGFKSKGGFKGASKKEQQDALAQRLSAILSSDAPDEDKNRAIELATGKGPGEFDNEALWEKALNLLGKPGSAVVNTVAEIGWSARDLVDGKSINEIGNPIEDIYGRVQKNQGFGDVLRQTGGTQDLPEPVITGLGLVGDIATDPLNLVTGGTSAVAGVASKGDDVARAGRLLSRTQLADELFKVGDTAAAQGVLKGTAKADDLARGSKALRDAGVIADDIKPGLSVITGKGKSVHIPGTERLRPLATGARGGVEKVAASDFGQGVGRAFNDAKKQALTNTMKRGGEEAAIAARQGLKELSLGKMAKYSYRADQESVLKLLQRDVRKARIPGQMVTAALDGGVGSQAWDEAVAIATRKGMPDLLERIRVHDDQMRQAFNAVVGDDIPELKVAYRTNHAPSLLSDPRAAARRGATGNPFTEAGFEKRAGIVAGEDFYGRPLLPASQQSKDEIVDGFRAIGDDETADYVAALDVHPEGLSPRQQAEQIASELGQDEIFNMDWFKASRAQVHAMANRLEGAVTEAGLRRSGVAQPRVTEQTAVAAAQKGITDPLGVANDVAPTPATTPKAADSQRLLASADPTERAAGRAFQFEDEADRVAAELGPEASPKLGSRRALDGKAEEIVGTFKSNMAAISQWSEAPEDFAEALAATARVGDSSKDLGPFLKGWDELTKTWKAYAVLSPGFHVRNLMGGAWNNFLANMNFRTYSQFNKAEAVYHKALVKASNLGEDAAHSAGLDAVERAMGRQHRLAYEQVHRTGILGTYGQIGDVGSEALAKANPSHIRSRVGAGVQEAFQGARAPRSSRNIVADNPFTRANYAVGQHVERRILRGSLAYDRALKGYLDADIIDDVFKYHFDYDDLSKLESGVIKRIVPFYCVPESHEILTKRGWLTHDQLVEGEPVMVLDPQTHEMRWEPLLDVATFDFDGELSTFERRGGEFLFTDDHRWPVETTRSFVKGKWYGGDRKIVRAHELNSTHKIPLKGDYRGTDSILDPRLAAILGWIVTDGYGRWRGNHWEAVVYQSPEKHLDEIIELLGTEPCKPHPDTGVVCVPVSLQDRKAITKHYRDKADLPDIVRNLSRDAAEAMYDAMIKAEGSTTRGGTQFAQTAGPVMEAFQVLCLMTGRNAWVSGRTSGDMQQAYVKSSDFLYAKEGIGRRRYQGTIWCPKTPTGTWIMRNGGAVIPTGNTWTRKNLPLQIEMLLAHPEKFNRIGQVQRNVEDMSSEEGTVPEWFKSQGAIRLPFYVKMGESIADAQFSLDHDPGFDQVYLTPDIPAQDLQLLTDPKQFTGMVNPMAKAPVELMAGKQFWNDVPIKEGYTPAPAQWKPLALAMEKIGLAKRDPNGELLIKHSDVYAIESVMPAFGRARRLLPSEKKYDDRLATTLVNFIFGAGVRTNTESDRKGEEYRRRLEIDKLAAELQSAGFGGYYDYTNIVPERVNKLAG